MKQVITNIIKVIALWALQGIVGAVFVIAGAMLLIEWFAGCGESYVDSKGMTHTNTCLFIGRVG